MGKRNLSLHLVRQDAATQANVRLFLAKEFYQMFRWFNEAGFQADIGALRRRYPEIHLQTLEEWLRREGWHKRARHIQAPKG